MRFVLCVVIAALLPGSALAAKSGEALSLSRTQEAAARGDQKAQFALSTTTDHESCMSGCASRGHAKGECSRACRPGICHPGGEQPYCVR
jgi:hypothetical protein